MTGETDVSTSIYIYTEHNGSIIENRVDIPAFKNEVTTVWYTNN
jgi:hypothetical protein